MSGRTDFLHRSPLDSVPARGIDRINSLSDSPPVLYERLRPSRFNVQTTTTEGWLLLWNTYAGSMNAFRPERRSDILKMIDQGGVPASDGGIARYLLDRGYLIPSGADELRRIRYAFGKENHRSDRLELILLASEDCNFRCTYCYEDFKRGTMRPEVRQGIKSLVERRAEVLNEMTVGWFGGEPLYGMEAIEDLAPFFAETAAARGIEYFSHMTTNGYLLTSDVVDKLLSWKISDFQVTLDGIAKDHDRLRPRRDGLSSFDVVYENLVAMRNRDDDFSVVVRVNFDRVSKHGLPALLDRLQSAFRDDDRFTISFHAVGQWGGDNDANLDVCGRGESHAVRMKFKAAARTMGLRVTSGWRPGISVGSEVCYAVRPYNFIVGAHGDIMKCTVDLDKKDRNLVGKLLPDGTLDLDVDKMALWTEPAFESDRGCQSCHMLPACQGVHCPQVRMDHNIAPCPGVRRTAKQEMLDYFQAKQSAMTPDTVSAGGGE